MNISLLLQLTILNWSIKYYIFDEFELAMIQTKMKVESAYLITKVSISENEDIVSPPLDYGYNKWRSEFF